jgi:hypothetical protein
MKANEMKKKETTAVQEQQTTAAAEKAVSLVRKRDSKNMSYSKE